MPEPGVLQAELEKIGIDLLSNQIAVLQEYVGELEHWNRRINLTALAGRELVRRLVVEPIWAALQLKPAGVYVDIGSGNGSPAIPWCVVCAFSRAHLVEARLRRAAFLRRAAARLGVRDVVVHRSRFEDIARTLGPADWITLQGVALTAKLTEKIRQTGPSTTRIVLTASPQGDANMKLDRRLDVPSSNRQYWVVRL